MDDLWRGLIGSFFGLRAPQAGGLKEREERRKDRRAASSIEVNLQWEDTEGQLCSSPGVLENVSPHGFAIRTAPGLQEGQTVWVTRPDSPALKSVVRHMRRDNGACLLGLSRVAHEHRREDRRPVAGTALLKRTGDHGETLVSDIEIRNISSEGVQMACSEFVAKNEVVRLLGSAVECMGAVRYCVPWQRKFLVGLFLIGKAHRRSSEEVVYD